jgi:hypothetical protein
MPAYGENELTELVFPMQWLLWSSIGAGMQRKEPGGMKEPGGKVGTEPAEVPPSGAALLQVSGSRSANATYGQNGRVPEVFHAM